MSGVDVLGLCTHLLGGDFALLSGHRDHHHRTPPPEGPTDAEFIAWLDTLQVEWVRAARRLSPRFVIDLLGWTGAQVVEMFGHKDPRERSASVWWAGPDLVPVWLDQVGELSEYWVHRQQPRWALGRPSDLQPVPLGLILEGFRWAYPFRLAGTDADNGATVSIEISGPFSTTWLLVRTEAGWEFTSRPGPLLVARTLMTADQAWRLLSNNLTLQEQDRLQITGDPEVGKGIRETRSVIGSPK